VEFSKLKNDLRQELVDILDRAQFVEKQTQARDAAVDRLTRAEAIAMAANLHDLLGWIPGLKVETARQTAATAVSVSASVTGDDVVSATGVVRLHGDLMTTEFEALEDVDYALLDDFSGDATAFDNREALTKGIFKRFARNYSRRFEFALTDKKLRDKVLLSADVFETLISSDSEA
jgi:hypothetical protein